MRVLITGGAGFVGSRMALLFRDKFPQAEITVFDNLKRRGSERNLPSFKRSGIRFIHGDIRAPFDFEALSDWKPDMFIEASAEPSVHAGVGEDPHYLLDTNLRGTINCLEYARSRCGFFVFLSTSRVYPIPDLRSVPLVEESSRFVPAADSGIPGFSQNGISEEFTLARYRSLYGSTKLCSELIVQEYIAGMGLRGVINRCGVIAGAGQFGKVDQGVFTLWVAMHAYGQKLRYTGFGGEGKQVRDLLHPSDLFNLIEIQADRSGSCSGEVYNVGGGLAGSVSLKELTVLCQELTGRKIPVASDPETKGVDIPWYVTDNTKVREAFGWVPEWDARAVVSDISGWIDREYEPLRELFC